MRAEVIEMGVNEWNRVWINTPVGMLCITLDGLDTIFVVAHHIPKNKVFAPLAEGNGFVLTSRESV